MASEISLPAPPQMDCKSDPTMLGARWTKWLRTFEVYLTGRGVKGVGQKKALLLYCGGMDLQDIYETLSDPLAVAPDGDDEYKKAVRTLKHYFVPKSNVPFERHRFRQMYQGEEKEDETLDQFVSRLQTQASICEYGDKMDEQVRDQLVEKCQSKSLRKKLLGKGNDLTLSLAQDLGRAVEAVDRQSSIMEGHSCRKSDVNRVTFTGRSRGKRPQHNHSNAKCGRCGLSGHLSRDDKCPAKDKECHKCHKVGHFASKCKTSDQKRSFNKQSKVHQLEESSDSEYAFHVTGSINRLSGDKLTFTVGGVELDMLVDSGSDSNVIGITTWQKLKDNNIKCVSSKSSRNLFPYMSDKPLPVKGTFKADIKAGDQVVKDAQFTVIDGEGQPLLGCETAKQLQVIQIGLNLDTTRSDVKAVGVSNNWQQQFPEVFTGLGKIKNRQIKLKIDPEVKPIVQPVRRPPFGLRKKVEKKIEQLLDADIIEKVEEPSEWVSPVVIVPKPNDEVRVCVDMRRVNEAVMRERHPIPTVDETLQEMTESTVFSKIDLKEAYHQLELHPDSRPITTFVTHCGLFRYKRLCFGINTAAEIAQHEVHKIIQGIEGTANVSDDIIIHGKTETEHDHRVKQVLQKLREAGATVNPKKCQFGVSEVVFMGHHLTKRGINPTQERIKAVVEAREPELPSEVRSFLGLVGYSSKFIPDYASIAEPLRKLTRKGEEFVFGKEEKKAFQQLKSSLQETETLGYFDLKAKTIVMADASPVGLGAVLIQEQRGDMRVISYASRSLSKVERRYSQTEKEALGLVWACEKFHAYIYGIEFDLVTDHKPLQVIYGPLSKPCARIERWVLRMMPYKYKVVHIPGTKNIADALSRLVKQSPPSDSLSKAAEDYVRFIAVEATPDALTPKEVEIASAQDEVFAEVRECIATGDWSKCSIKAYSVVKSELCTIGKLIMRGTRIVIPQSLRGKIITLAHEGHLGIVGTKQNLRSRVWWPGIDRETEKFCRHCHGCQITSRPDPPEPIRSTDLPTGPWEDLATDFLGPFPSGESILVIVDYYSRYYEYKVMRSTTTEKTIEVFQEVFARHGLPASVSSDNGPQFRSQFSDFLEKLGIVHHRVTPRWPRANGEVERQNQSIMKRIRIAQAEKRDWRKGLLEYVAAYRSVPHTTTGKSPAEALFGRKIRTKIPEILVSNELLDFEMRDRDGEKKGIGKRYADEKRQAKYSDITLGESVMVKRDQRQNKLDTPFIPKPFTVVAKAGSKVTVESDEGVQYDRNSSHVKRYNPPEEVKINEQPTSSEPEINIEPKTPMKDLVCRPKREQKLPAKYEDFVLKY